MTHQLVAPVSRTPAASLLAANVTRAKTFAQSGGCAPPATPRTGLALLSNENKIVAAPANTVDGHLKATHTQHPEVLHQQRQPQQQQHGESERCPPPPSAYETPFEWEILPDTDDWLRLLRRFGGGGSGSRVFGVGEDFMNNNKENVPPGSPADSEASESPTDGGCRYWDESPTRPRRHDDDCVEICFDIDRIL